MIWFALVLGLFNLAALVALVAAGYWAWLKAKPIVVPMLAMLGPPPTDLAAGQALQVDHYEEEWETPRTVLEEPCLHCTHPRGEHERSGTVGGLSIGRCLHSPDCGCSAFVDRHGRGL